MSIPDYMYKKEVIEIVDKFIHLGYKSFESLDESDKAEIVSTVMACQGNDAIDFIVEGNGLDIIVAKIKLFLENEDDERKENLTKNIKKFAIEYHSKQLSELYQEQYINITQQDSYLDDMYISWCNEKASIARDINRQVAMS